MNLDDCVMVNEGHLYFKSEHQKEKKLFGFGREEVAFIFYFYVCVCFARSLE